MNYSHNSLINGKNTICMRGTPVNDSLVLGGEPLIGESELTTHAFMHRLLALEN